MSSILALIVFYTPQCFRAIKIDPDSDSVYEIVTCIITSRKLKLLNFQYMNVTLLDLIRCIQGASLEEKNETLPEKRENRSTDRLNGHVTTQVDCRTENPY